MDRDAGEIEPAAGQACFVVLNRAAGHMESAVGNVNATAVLRGPIPFNHTAAEVEHSPFLDHSNAAAMLQQIR